MPSVRIIYDVDGWAYHHEARALQKYAPADFSVAIAPLHDPDGSDADAALGADPVDLVFLLREFATPAIAAALQRRQWQHKLVVGWSCGFPRRLDFFHAVRAAADAWIFNNRECWEHSGRLPRTHVLANGVDLETFAVTRPMAQRAPRVLWVGSERYRQLKGYDDLILPLQDRLRARGIASEAMLVDSYGPNKRTPQEMAAWYNDGTVLVCASASEGTPNPGLEAAACGCTLVSTRVGNMPELIRDGVNGYLVERSLDALEAGVVRACAEHPRLAAQMQSDIRAWHWAARSGEFFALFRTILADRDDAPAPRRDLSDAVTVFVTTAGASPSAACLAHLREQDCRFTLRVIDHVAPPRGAPQQMLRDCRTPYYVHVDDNTLLHPHAVRTLYETIAAAPPNVAIYAAELYDLHLQRGISGVRIFRHDVVRHYSVQSMQAFDVDQALRLEADGYRLLRQPAGLTPAAAHALGVHCPQATAASTDTHRVAAGERRAAAESPRFESSDVASGD
ncbi:MAG: glycosyltransferase [bacterium]